MKKLWTDRRMSTAWLGILVLGGLAAHQGVIATQAVAYPILLLAGGVAAANALEAIKGKKDAGQS